MGPWTATGTAARRLGGERKGAAHLQGVERIRDWTRARFGLSDDDLVMVSEERPLLPGFPPVATRVAFWIGETRHHFRAFKPAREVTESDVPPAWLRNALAGDGLDCECC